PALGDRPAPAKLRQGRAEVPDLSARVVEVVLARDPLAAGLEDATEQVADERAAGIPDVERTRRVGRDELDIDRARLDRSGAAPVSRARQDRSDDRLERRCP